MNIGFVSDSLSTTAGGIFEIERSLALHLRGLGISVTAWGVRDEPWERVADEWDGIECRLRERSGPRIFGYVPGLVSDLVDSDCELLHLQHLWMYPSVAVHRWYRRTGRPYLVTANGMLEPWTLSRSKWIKRAAALCYENRMLRSAASLQANTEKEAADFRAYGLRNPICLIPNGVALPELSSSEPLRQRSGGPRVLLFLGRLHPKKGLVNALRAWAEVMGEEARGTGREAWQFVIAGWDQGGHGDELKALCRELGLDYSDNPSGNSDSASPAPVIFNGPAFGKEKDALMRKAEAFILPSFSEGLPMAVLEAWAYGIPVLMTDHCNLPEGFTADAAIRIGTEVPGIAGGLRELFQGLPGDLEAMGGAGRTLVEEQFTWPKVAAQMKEVYEWMLGGGTRPGCLV
jgi:glycosyltransferase involved in cell wall biosynthesis